MNRLFSTIAFFAVFLSAACLIVAQNQGQGAPEIIQHKINPHGAGAVPTSGGTGVITPAITYHNGPVLSAPVIYYIWYGNWNQTNGSDTPDGQKILRDLAIGIGSSPYFKLNQSYSTSSTTITGAASFGGETTDNYSQGSRLRDAAILTIVQNAVGSGKLPYDIHGVYFVLTSSDVTEQTGFCNKYCGWHTQGIANSGTFRYAFVGNAFRCLNSCAEQTTGPNGNAGVDGMASVIAHELEESTTDPDASSGWFDRQGAENADKCAWTFGQSSNLSKAANGAYYNMLLNGRPFLIQRNLYHDQKTGDTCRLDATRQ
jgi:Phosphate-induced protein 1 conserved region